MQVKARLSSDSARCQFQDFVVQSDPNSSQFIGVREVNVAFPFTKCLLEVIDEALGLSSQKGELITHRPDVLPPVERCTPISSLPFCSSISRVAAVAHTMSSRARQSLKRSESLNKRVRCSLPYIDWLYKGKCAD